MTRRRIALYTQQEAADLTGLPVTTIAALERSFLTDAQRAYLELVGYCVGYYPRRKPKKGKKSPSQSPDPQSVTTLSDDMRLLDE